MNIRFILMMQNQFPQGWDENKVCEIISYYDAQTDDEIVAEMEELSEACIFVELPTDLLPIVRSLIAKYEQGATLESLYELVQIKPALARPE